MAAIPIAESITQGNKCPVCRKYHRLGAIAAAHAAKAEADGYTGYDYDAEKWVRAVPAAGFWIWRSVNGVDHLVPETGSCATCGRAHERVFASGQRVRITCGNHEGDVADVQRIEAGRLPGDPIDVTQLAVVVLAGGPFMGVTLRLPLTWLA